MGFWFMVWIAMAVAFCCAWLFIVKGCEAMDDGNPPKEGFPDEPSH
ncbi:MAG: hypothetical protein QGG36_27230 [Pirellulaceae bacterium]|jgi:hypothetical protein|nr:hypothetical protein [Pirellulaceae bacterium]MDP7019520.1 hypothetical protein [Pirellulaceae bacterium]